MQAKSNKPVRFHSSEIRPCYKVLVVKTYYTAAKLKRDWLTACEMYYIIECTTSANSDVGQLCITHSAVDFR